MFADCEKKRLSTAISDILFLIINNVSKTLKIPKMSFNFAFHLNAEKKKLDYIRK